MDQGKRFEEDFFKSAQPMGDVSIDRLYDTTSGWAGHANICDFILFKQPFQYYLELKSTQTETFDVGNIPEGKYRGISQRQYEGLYEKSHIQGVFAGLLVEFRIKPEHQVWFVNINTVREFVQDGKKSFKIDDLYLAPECYQLTIQRKRTRFKIDVDDFLQNF